MADETKVIEILLEIQRKQDELVRGSEQDRDAALGRHRTVLARFDAHEKRLDDLEAKRGNTDPPTAEVAKEAKRVASSASLEAAAVEGRLLSFAASSDARLERLETALAANNIWTQEIRDFLRSITSSKAVRAAVIGFVVTAFGALGAIIHGAAK